MTILGETYEGNCCLDPSFSPTRFPPIHRERGIRIGSTFKGRKLSTPNKKNVWNEDRPSLDFSMSSAIVPKPDTSVSGDEGNISKSWSI
jgi:hypothetical protein